MFPIAAGRVRSRSPGGRPSSWAATGRSGGSSAAPFDTLNLASYVGDDADAVSDNRGRLAALLGQPPDRLAVMDAVHGREVAHVTTGGVFAGVDALVTQEADLILVALGADCVPVALVGDDGRTLAVAHCGWRGLVADVVGAALGAMRELGSGVELAVLGPAVCGRCYPVPPERASEVSVRCSAAVSAAGLVSCPDGQPGIDVRSGVKARLTELGVPDASITLAGGCTVEDTHLFSFRRDGLTGRQGVAVCSHSVARMEP
jgi:YfiH family protein